MSEHTLGASSRGFNCPRLAIILVALVIVPIHSANAQVGEGRRIYDQQLRMEMDQETPEMRERTIDGGGWFNYSFYDFEDTAGQQHTLNQYDLRPWASLNDRGVHKAYVRGLFDWSNWKSGQNTEPWNGDNTSEQQVERAWYEFDLGRMIQNQTKQAPPLGLRVKVGREYTELGSGFVMSMPLDMIQMEADAGKWRFRALIGQTDELSNNIDTSLPVETHQDRCMWGFEADYMGFDHHQPYVYFLSNTDHSRPDPHVAGQGFDYSSQYIGGGSRGALSPKLRYLGEVVGEFGETYSDGVNSGEDGIQAMAADAQLEYLFGGRMKPKVSSEYIFASGDKDRKDSSVATIGGNQHNTYDTAFNAFGFRDTGLSFAPRISNLHMYDVGASFLPFEGDKLFDKLELGSKTFLYTKAASGAASDSAAEDDSWWLGWEWDVYANWRITSDLSWTIRYGAFMPGSAFENEDCKQFLFTGITLSF